MFEDDRGGGPESSGCQPGAARTPGRVLADPIVARDVRIRSEELGTVRDLLAWLDLHSVDESDPLAHGVAGGAGRPSGSDGTPLVDEFAVREYAALRHQAEATARAFLTDVADLEHRFPRLWEAVQALWLPVWQARKIVAACRELSKEAAALVDAEMAAKVSRLSWGRITTVLAAAIMNADPVQAEAKRQQAKQARFVQLCRSEAGINTMIVRADHGDLIMVYALVDRLADILGLEGSDEPADERRATAFGLLAQPAMVLQLLLRHAGEGSPPNDPATPAEAGPDPASGPPGSTDVDDEQPVGHDSRQTPAESGQGPDSEAPDWTDDDYEKPADPEPVDHPNIPDYWQQRLRPAPEAPAPGWAREPGDHDRPDGAGLRLDLPGLADLLSQRGFKAARPRVTLNVHLTDQTLATGTGVVRVDGSGPILATQLREFLGRHSCQISIRPVLDLDRIPSVDAYEIPHRIRDAVRVRNVASVFPYSGAPAREWTSTTPTPTSGTVAPVRPDRRISAR